MSNKYEQLHLFHIPTCRVKLFTDTLITLCKCFAKSDLEFDEFMSLLHQLCDNYRKELQTNG